MTKIISVIRLKSFWQGIVRRLLLQVQPAVSQAAINLIQELHPDLVLLDINMRDGTGFDLLNAFPSIDFKVIFISAFDKNTIRAFKLSGLEYLMKPVNPGEITPAINRVMNTEVKYFALKLKNLVLNKYAE